MILKLKSNKVIRQILFANLLIITVVSALLYGFNLFWNTIDYKLTDYLYSKVISGGKGPALSSRISFVNINDKTYDYFASSSLKRSDLARLNRTLGHLNPEAVMYDIIFRSQSTSGEDMEFSSSAKDLSRLYLPAGFYIEKEPGSYAWTTSKFNELLKNSYLQRVNENGSGRPYCAKWSVTQNERFASLPSNSGHINVNADRDGIFRHYPLIIKVDSLFFPSISLIMFLDYNHIPFSEITVNWGRSIIIPALKGSFLDKDMEIPIDESGNAFIPFPCIYEKIPRKLTVQQLLEFSKDGNYYTKLLEYFEGNFVFIADISTGISDIGQNPLEENVPKVITHSAMLNSLLTDTFYREMDKDTCLIIMLLAGLVILISMLPKSNLWFYSAGVILLAGLVYYINEEIYSHTLVPGATLLAYTVLIFTGGVISQHLINSKEQAFIRNAFSKYLPESMISRISDDPRLLSLGGEERTLTIMFIDIAGFTSMAERLKAEEMVGFLNQYFSLVTDIIIEHGGIVDKYIGDGILAEFGAPLALENHQEAATRAALMIQEKLKELNRKLSSSAIGEVKCRIGINTGQAIVGNMGSEKVFDYTAVGDAVNLASRLEGANKLFGTSILISQYTLEGIPEGIFSIRALGRLTVKGKSEPVQVYEVTGVNVQNLI